MRVQVDENACSGFGVCAETCPSVFEIDDSGFARVRTDGGLVPEADEEAARTAVLHCPERAISEVE